MTLEAAFVSTTICGLISIGMNIVLFILWFKSEKKVAKLGGKSILQKKKENENVK